MINNISSFYFYNLGVLRRRRRMLMPKSNISLDLTPVILEITSK